MMNVLRILAACGAVASTIATAEAQGTDWAKVDGILGRTGRSAAKFIVMASRERTCRSRLTA